MGLLDWLRRDGDTSIRFREREEIPVPGSFSGIDMEELYCRHYSGFFARIADGVVVDMWNRDLGGSYVTLVLDRYLDKIGATGGILYITAWEECNTGSYITLRNIEMLGSGVRYTGSFRHQEKDVAMLTVDRNISKKNISIPVDAMVGFDWGANGYDDKICRWENYPVSRFGGDMVLNFAASGEFNLSIFFERERNNSSESPDTDKLNSDKLDCLFSKNFCCK